MLTSAALLAGCESYGGGYASRPYPTPYSSAPTYSPPPQVSQQEVAALRQRVSELTAENEDQRQKILLLLQNVQWLNRTVCLLSTRLERAKVKTDPANGRNYVVADPGPVRQPTENC